MNRASRSDNRTSNYPIPSSCSEFSGNRGLGCALVLDAGFPISEEEVEQGMIARHRLVHIHPGSGRKSLYIASHALRITGMDKEEGRALIRELIDFATQPQFTFAHHWKPGDLVIWDNFSTMHRGGDYDDVHQRRDMRRTTVMAYPPPPIVLDPRFAGRFDPSQYAAMIDA